MEFLLQKMKSAQDEQVQYWLGDGTQQINLNALIGHTLTFEFTGAIFCQECQKKIKKSFGEGFCFNCFSTAAAASPCILHPELCQAVGEMSEELFFCAMRSFQLPFWSRLRVA